MVLIPSLPDVCCSTRRTRLPVHVGRQLQWTITENAATCRKVTLNWTRSLHKWVRTGTKKVSLRCRKKMDSRQRSHVATYELKVRRGKIARTVFISSSKTYGLSRIERDKSNGSSVGTNWFRLTTADTDHFPRDRRSSTGDASDKGPALLFLVTVVFFAVES